MIESLKSRLPCFKHYKKKWRRCVKKALKINKGMQKKCVFSRSRTTNRNDNLTKSIEESNLDQAITLSTRRRRRQFERKLSWRPDKQSRLTQSMMMMIQKDILLLTRSWRHNSPPNGKDSTSNSMMVPQIRTST